MAAAAEALARLTSTRDAFGAATGKSTVSRSEVAHMAGFRGASATARSHPARALA